MVHDTSSAGNALQLLITLTEGVPEIHLKLNSFPCEIIIFQLTFIVETHLSFNKLG